MRPRMTDDFRSDDQPQQPAQPPPPPRKEPRTPRQVLSIAMVATATVDLGFGLPALVWPNLLWDTVGGADGGALAALESARWAGALLVAFGIGAVFVLMRPRGQRTMVTVLCIQASLTAAAILFSAANNEFDGVVDDWFYWATGAATTLVAAYLWFARFKARSELALSPAGSA